MPDMIKYSSVMYIVYTEEQYLEAARLFWLEFGKNYIDSGISQTSKPESYPVVVTFDAPHDQMDDEPAYITSSFLYPGLISKLLEAMTMYNSPQNKEGDHILANAPKVGCNYNSIANVVNAKDRPSSRFSKVGTGQYTVESIEGFKAAAVAFWAEHKLPAYSNILSLVKGSPTRYPAYITFVTECDEDLNITGILANCIYIETLSKTIAKYV